MSIETNSKWSPCASWLGRKLASGPVAVPAVEAAAKSAGYSQDELVAAVREVGPNRDAGAKPAAWSLSDGDRHYWAEFSAGLDEGRQAAAIHERERIRSIVTSEAARGRRALADHLALKTDTEVPEAIALLAVSPLATVGLGNPIAEYLAGARTDAAPAPRSANLERSNELFGRRAHEAGHGERH